MRKRACDVPDDKFLSRRYPDTIENLKPFALAFVYSQIYTRYDIAHLVPVLFDTDVPFGTVIPFKAEPTLSHKRITGIWTPLLEDGMGELGTMGMSGYYHNGIFYPIAPNLQDFSLTLRTKNEKLIFEEMPLQRLVQVYGMGHATDIRFDIDNSFITKRSNAVIPAPYCVLIYFAYWEDDSKKRK